MAAAITVESLDSGKALVDERDELATHEHSEDKAGFDVKIATFMISTMRCRMAITLIMTLVARITLEGRESVAEVQVDEGIIPVIADLDVPLVMGRRPKKLIKATRETAMVSWDRKRKGPEGEDGPLPSERMKSLEALLFCRYNLRIPAR